MRPIDRQSRRENPPSPLGDHGRFRPVHAIAGTIVHRNDGAAMARLLTSHRLALASILAAAACAKADAAPRQPDRMHTAGSTAGVTVRGVHARYIAGAYVTTGEVVNQTGAAVYDVVVQVAGRGAGGATLASGTADVLLSRVEPGGTAPLMDVRRNAPRGITSAAVSVKAFSRSGRVDVRPVTIEMAQVIRGITGPVVVGRARNQSGATLESVQLVSWYRDASGKVTNVSSRLIGRMRPGQVHDFTIEVDEAISRDRLTVRAEGRVAS